MARQPATTSAERGEDHPVSGSDPFSREFLTDPYPLHEELREAGPVVRLSAYDHLWATARHEQVHAVLDDWETFCSSGGVGLSDFRKETPWRPPSLVLEADPPLHTRTRAILTRILSPAAVRKLRKDFARDAEALAQEIVDKREFDAVTDFCEIYPMKVVADAVGVPDEGRENLIAYGSMSFSTFGPRNWIFEDAMKKFPPVHAWVMANCERDVLAQGGFGAQIYQAADAGEITLEQAPLLVRTLLTAGIDTAVNAFGNAFLAFARHPVQWAKLRDDPSLWRFAFEEALRYDSPIQMFFRTTTRPVEIGNVSVPEGEKMLVFLGAANRDPRKWQNPERFDITRDVSGHLAMGAGIHGCVGQMVARLEAESVFNALAKRIDTMELTGEPQLSLNNTSRGYSSIPIAVRPR